MAVYGTLVAWAQRLELTEVEALLEHTLEEEEAADETLSDLAESGIAVEASEAPYPGGEAQVAQVTEVGRAVYELKVGDWVCIVPGLCRHSAGARLRVPQADVNCWRLPQRGRLG